MDQRRELEAERRDHTALGNLYDDFYHFLFEFPDGKVIRWMEYTNSDARSEVLGMR